MSLLDQYKERLKSLCKDDAAYIEALTLFEDCVMAYTLQNYSEGLRDSEDFIVIFLRIIMRSSCGLTHKASAS